MLRGTVAAAALWAGGIGAALAQATSAPADLRAIVARARPSILPVGTYSATANPRFGFRGSGFVVGDGQHVATNAHVLPAGAEAEPAARLAVLAQSAAPGREAGDLRFATVVAIDRAHDIALLRFDGPALPPLGLAAGERPAEGKAVALIGFPIGGALGFSPVTHRGIVASLTTIALPAPTAAQLDPRALARLRAGNFEVLQLDATAYPGNSGGPVLDADTGEVIGVVNMVLVRGSRETALSTPTGISYAIPVQHVRALLEEARSATPPR
ncbi:MAG: trypsin-like peptidase domain-containing protein [Burkholderiales bacterium]|nr:trypsin-like peptidase domain-containing protein [Burkholderiales bacterium]